MVEKAMLAARLRSLADEMKELGSDMVTKFDDPETRKHGLELYQASKIADQWVMYLEMEARG